MAETVDDLDPVEPDEGESLHEELLEIVKTHDEAWSDAQQAYIEDFRFGILGEQWDQGDADKRSKQGRPALVYNRLPAFIRRVTNDARQEDQQIRVLPKSGASRVTAEILQGVVRCIQIDSDASSARATAHDSAAIGGYGWYRVAIEKEDGLNVLKIDRVRDALRITCDPFATRADRSDMKNAVIRYLLPKEQYEEMYGEEDGESIPETSQESEGWMTENSVTLAEVWRIEGPEESDDLHAARYIISGSKVLEEYRDYPGKYIPLIPIFGEEWEIDGKVVFKGLIRDAKTPQQMLNYWKSATAENLAQNRRARADVTPGMVDGFEEEWSDDTLNVAFRRYNPGPQGEKPSYPNPPQIPTGTVQAAGSDAEEMKAILGIFDANMGQKSNETSGRAIMARAAQGDIATYHFKDNLSRAIRLEGKILVDLIPHVYGEHEILQIAAEDGEITAAEVGAVHKLADGTEGYVSVKGGSYGVVISSGPGYATKRQETLNLMLDAAKAIPAIGQLGADKIVALMDFNGSYEFSQRLKRALPPGVAEQEGEDQQIPPQVKIQLEQMHQTIDQLTQHLTETTQALNEAQDKTQSDQAAKIAAAQLDAETRKQIALIQAQTDIEIARIQADAKREASEIAAQGRITEKALETEAQTAQAALEQSYTMPAIVPGTQPEIPPEEAQYL
ncbi:Phage P22-like portal protein [uncultured Caudovirales phage]|jgi:hypothetical protein|uniref:Phage P22-like portal protein n=1 Tax=uncultured Caudovirales phage TaxID=2100421 RepID=A0A6J5N4S1_9CAUD|nr:Phage P22-like portal protein [uncultured Caudovirales phage]